LRRKGNSPTQGKFTRCYMKIGLQVVYKGWLK